MPAQKYYIPELGSASNSAGRKLREKGREKVDRSHNVSKLHQVQSVST